MTALKHDPKFFDTPPTERERLYLFSPKPGGFNQPVGWPWRHYVAQAVLRLPPCSPEHLLRRPDVAPEVWLPKNHYAKRKPQQRRKGQRTCRDSTQQSRLSPALRPPQPWSQMIKEASRWFWHSAGQLSLFSQVSEIIMQRQTMSTMPSLNSWCKEAVSIIKWLSIFTTKFGAGFVTQQ